MINRYDLIKIKEKINNSILVNNIPNHNVEIVAVTKTFSSEAILAAFEEGILNIGENKIQEAEYKFPQLPNLPKLKKRLIGHLQSNKTLYHRKWHIMADRDKKMIIQMHNCIFEIHLIKNI